MYKEQLLDFYLLFFLSQLPLLERTRVLIVNIGEKVCDIGNAWYVVLVNVS